MVTSSAVVGSSAIISRGLQASAMAIMTRWRMPPLIWWGYSRRRLEAAGMPTNWNISTTRAMASARPSRWCRRITSATLLAHGEDRV